MTITMSFRSLCFLTAILAVASFASAAPVQETDIRRDAIVIAVEKVAPAVVNIATERVVEYRDPFEDMFSNFFRPYHQRGTQRSLGSGVFVDDAGYLVTNFHVVQRASKITVILTDGTQLEGKFIAGSDRNDLALVKVSRDKPFPFVPLAKEGVFLGETVVAIGNPFGFGNSVTHGIVSSKDRTAVDNQGNIVVEGVLQTDAAINPGNSGGPLVDARGEVVGINTFLISPSGTFSGMGFAIPTLIVKPTVDTLIRDGKVRHGRIGIGISDVTPENAKFFGDSTAMGGVVTQVEPDSPGAKAGLQTGDVITEIDGQKVNDAGELQVIVGQKQPGTKVNLTVLRNGKTMNVPVTLDEMGKNGTETGTSANEGHGKMRWGISLGNLSPDVRDQLQVPHDVHGALVEQVQPGSSADNAGLQQGDIILEVNRHKVQSASDVQQALSSVPKGQDALLLVWSNGGNTFRVLHSPEGSGA
jgi:serine protease Do